MAKGKSSRKDKDRKRRDDEKSQRELELSQENVEKGLEKQKENDEEQEQHRLELEKLQEKQKQETKDRFERLSRDMVSASRQRWESQVWSKYMNCDGRPDIEDPRQVNTFISRWMDRTLSKGGGEAAERDDLEPHLVLAQCDGAIQLIDDLDDLLREARHLPNKTSTDCALLKIELQNAINAKLDQSTLALLKGTSLCTDPETGNSYFYGRNETVEMAVWSNLSCNSRYGGMDANELGITFAIPRSLVITECAVRLLKVTADSPFMFSANCNRDRRLAQHAGSCNWNRSFNAITDGDDDVVDEQSSELSIQMNLMQSKDNNGAGDCDDGVLDLDEYFMVGSSIVVDLLAIPPQPRTIKNWVITRVEDPDTLRRIDWISDFAGIVSNADDDDSVKVDDESEREQAEEKAQEEVKKLVFMSIKLSEEVLWSDVPKIARREHYGGGADETIIWTTSGLHQIVHKEDNNTMSFCAARFGTFALFQSRFASFPYQAWEVSPCSPDDIPCKRVTFSLTTMLVTMEMEIQAGSCIVRQVQSNEKYFLKALYGKPVKPIALFKRLQAAGIYVTPKGRDSMYTTNIRQKDKLLEANVYRHMAVVAASSYVLSSSRWNSNAGRDQIVIRTRLPDQLPDKAKQPVILLTQSEATLLSINELSQAFSARPLEENSVALDLYHVVQLLRSPTSPNVGRRVSLDQLNVDPLFVDTVFQVLATCGVLRF